MNVAGRWKGIYFYDKPETHPDLHSTEFAMDLRRFLIGWIAGTIVDDPQSGIPVSATVRGSSWGANMKFVKRYRARYLFHLGKAITLTEAVRSFYNDDLIDDPRARDILYSGRWNPVENRFEGNWSIGPELLKLASGRWLKMPALTGTWHISRPDRNEPG